MSILVYTHSITEKCNEFCVKEKLEEKLTVGITWVPECKIWGKIKKSWMYMMNENVKWLYITTQILYILILVWHVSSFSSK